MHSFIRKKKIKNLLNICNLYYIPAYLKYSHEVDSCCIFDVDLLSFVSFDFKVPLDLLELLSLKLNNLLPNFGVDVIGELPLASGNKLIIIKY